MTLHSLPPPCPGRDGHRPANCGPSETGGGTARAEEGTTTRRLLCTPFTFPCFLGQEELNKEPEAEEPLTLGGKGCGHRGVCRPGRRAALLSALPALRCLPAVTLHAPIGCLIWFSFCSWKVGSNSIGPEERREEGSEHRRAPLARRRAPPAPGDKETAGCTAPRPATPLPGRPARTLHTALGAGTAGDPQPALEGGKAGLSTARERHSPAKQGFRGQPDTSLDFFFLNLLCLAPLHCPKHLL